MADTDTEEPGKVTQLLQMTKLGEGLAVRELYSLLYNDLRRLARARLRTAMHLTLLDTTALVHESFMRSVQSKQAQFSDRVNFFGYAATVMRSIVVDFVRSKKSERHGGAVAFVTLAEEANEAFAKQEDDFLHVGEALDELSKVDQRAARVVEMRYFVGMTEQEIAQALGVTERTVRRDWDKARMLLQVALS